jgi:hypothetical protein
MVMDGTAGGRSQWSDGSHSRNEQPPGTLEWHPESPVPPGTIEKASRA